MPTQMVDVEAYQDGPVVIIGRMPVNTARRFSDTINGIESSFITLEDCRPMLVSAAAGPADGYLDMGSSSVGQIRKSDVAFVARGPETPEEYASRPVVRVAATKCRVSFQTRGWLITGEIAVQPSRPLETLMTLNLAGNPFLAVASATATYIADQDVRVRADVLMLNRSAVVAFYPYALSL